MCVNVTVFRDEPFDELFLCKSEVLGSEFAKDVIDLVGIELIENQHRSFVLIMLDAS